MIKSMTAFAGKSLQAPGGELRCELKSVNSRFLEVNFRLPETLRYLEVRLREILRKRLGRGKIDLTLKIERFAGEDAQLHLNTNLLKQLLEVHKQVQHETKALDAPTAITFMQWPGVVEAQEVDMSQLEKDIVSLLEQTVSELIEVRQREGEQLKQTVQQRVDNILEHVDIVKSEMPKALSWQHQRIKDRFAEAGVSFETERLEQELVLLAQKVDVAEELDRLGVHVSEVKRILEEGGQVGRRLDFLMQELNREANTLGAKSITTKITAAAIEIKVLIEQMREQVQNIE